MSHDPRNRTDTTVTRERESDRFQFLVDSMTRDSVFALDADGIITSWNDGAARNMGYQAAEMVGRPLATLYVWDDVVAGRPAHVLSEARTRGSFEEECWRLCRDGDTYWALVTVTALRDAAGVHVGYSHVSRNLTEQRIAQETLRLRDHALRGLSQSVCITGLADTDFAMIYVNDGFLTMTGYSREEVLGRNCRMLQGADTDAAAVATLKRSAVEGVASQVVIRNYRKDGTAFWNALSLSPLTDGEGRVTQMLGVQSDISTVKALEAQLAQSQKAEALGRLTGGIAHDFNNMLTVILGCGELVLQDLVGQPGSRDLVLSMVDAAERAAALTRHLLAFSRQTVLETKIVNLNAVVVDTERLLGRVLGDDIQLVTTLTAALPVVDIDAGQFGQILLNLAVNARDAMPHGGELRITTDIVPMATAMSDQVWERGSGQCVQLVIQDTGTGMTEDVRSRVFEPFFTTKDTGKGIGLGLSTVYGIVRQSGGTIRVESVVGRGTTFTISMPLARRDAELPVPPTSIRALRGTETVLLVEDDADVRKLTKRLLTKHGYAVIEADNAADAVRRIAEGVWLDLLLTDVVMPDMSGVALAAEVEALRPGTKIVLMTGYTEDDIAMRAIDVDRTAIVLKPFSAESLTSRIREVLDAR